MENPHFPFISKKPTHLNVVYVKLYGQFISRATFLLDVRPNWESPALHSAAGNYTGPVLPLRSLFPLNSSGMKWTRGRYPSGDGTYSDFTRHRGIIRALRLDGILCFYELCAVIH